MYPALWLKLQIDEGVKSATSNIES